MPGSLLPDAEIEHDRLGEALNAAPSLATSIHEAIGVGQLTPLVVDAAQGLLRGPGRRLEAEEANRDYGVDGFLSFDGPVFERDAARKQAGAQRRAWSQDVLGRSDMPVLGKIGLSIGGAMIDPVGLPLIFAPEALGLRGAMEGAMASRGVGILAKSGRLANGVRGALAGAVEGGVGTAIYEAPNYGLRRYSGEDDYDLGDSLSNLLLGTVLGGVLGGGLGAVLGDARPHPVRQMEDEGRVGAAALAIDRAVDDAPVNVAPLIERELPKPAPEVTAALDDVPEVGAIRSRPLEDAVAVTTRGREIPVRYAVVELNDLVTSHGDDLQRNPAFPEALQPRDRARAGSQAGNYRLEQELNPKRLMRDSGAETGAPLIAADGTVESGNGRTIALRRSARTGSGAYDRYKAELAAQGIDVEGFENPVLVRVRTQAMSGEERAALTREMNAAPTETMGPAEQAMADAATLDEAMLGHLDGTPAGDRAFARAFLAKVAPDQQNAMADAEGALSAAGQNRIKAALVARAYDDPRLVEAVFEAADPNIKTVGQALSEAASGWAAMRALASRGEIPAELDITEHLRRAVDMIRHARDNKIPVDEWIAQRLDQVELFGGNVVEPETEAFLRMFFTDGTFKRHRAAAKISWALRDYARQASDVTPGPNLFGETPDGDAKLILEGLARKFAGDEPFPAQADLLTAPKPAEPAVVDLRPDAGDGGRKGLQPDGGGGVEEGGVKPRTDPLTLIDPELKALAEQDLGDALQAAGKKADPNIIAEAIRAAAFCLSEGGS